MPHVIIACSASVAAIKIPDIVSQLINKNIDVTLVATEASKHFVDLEKIKNDFKINVVTNEHEWSAWKYRGDPVLHIDLSKSADLLVLAPLSANTLAKISNGICDNLLTCIVRAWSVSKPVLFCPAMNTNMWNHPITERQINTLISWGYCLIPPIVKTLMCGDHGIGAMAEVESIVLQIFKSLNVDSS
ncbi:phosphopantothenoylcysteine decarboxylase [Daktulosphaira vitifoliae]|uniref:phosphopantothenoylcysteine decarboxylase n=1 Tax=Daktulosphaira vitifoliae TaxID=58002 RepID=UPI0021A9D946|nr:phosphopantothenoylcysteine decarboxylase [Daktulosphaira vitifoliae]